MRWSDQPGYKVEVPRRFLETLAEHVADPEKWAYMLREHARTPPKQLGLTRNNIWASLRQCLTKRKLGRRLS